VIYRGMHESDGKPVIGDTKKKLGVVAAPASFPDVMPDANGNVHPPIPSNSQGMSAAPTIQDLPRFRRLTAWGGTEASPTFKVWRIDEADLGPDLVTLQDSVAHVTIGPARPMSLAEFRAALANTQNKWTMVRRP
jgi:hypothetical protein